MIAFPNAKINIGLNILGKRTDGYHDIFSCFYPIKWCDVLEIIESRELDFYTSGIDIPGNKSDNLCIKAYELLKQDYDIPPVNIYLHKVIPMGAGLGGGSADAAFTLKLLNQKFDLKLSNKDLERYAGRLGSDCTFFINNKPAIATERGQILKPHLLDLSDYYCVLINPSIHQSTAEAYNSVNFSKPVGNIEEILSESQIESWQKTAQQ